MLQYLSRPNQTPHTFTSRGGSSMKPALALFLTFYIAQADPHATAASTCGSAKNRPCSPEDELFLLQTITKTTKRSEDGASFNQTGDYHSQRHGMALRDGACQPQCTWNCASQPCQETCAPKCPPPNCTTQCDTPSADDCMVECQQPHCAVVCPKNLTVGCDPTNGTCGACTTNCSKPVCRLNCGDLASRCTQICQPPQCKWKCTAPTSCPQPDCVLQCTSCAGTSLLQTKPDPPPGGIEVEHFETPQSVLDNQASSVRVPVTSIEISSGRKVTRFVNLPVKRT